MGGKRRPRFTVDNWARSGTLGANDGIVSTASLVVGVAAGGSGRGSLVLVLVGIAGLVAGAMSLAAGEYVSVHSQAIPKVPTWTWKAPSWQKHPRTETKELADIYAGRGLKADLALKVAEQLMAHDALGAHARDELGISAALRPKPVQAALASAASFAIGAALPVGVVALTPPQNVTPWIFGLSLAFLAALGAIAAKVGGAPVASGVGRVAVWGALAMAITAGAGALFGTVA